MEEINLNKVMDETMEISHQITANIIECVKSELTGKKLHIEELENNKIFKTMYEKLQENYREIQEYLEEKELDIEYKEDYDEIKKMQDILTQNREGKMESYLKSMTISDLDLYLESAYVELRYIDMMDGKGSTMQESIYKNTGFEALRNVEYHIQHENLENISSRNVLKDGVNDLFSVNKDGAIEYLDKNLSFVNKACVIEYMAKQKFYKEYAISQIEKYINDLENKKEDLEQIEYETLRRKLIEQKYIIFYEYLNNKYNGILQENEKGSLAIIKEHIDLNSETILLNMTQFEIDENIKCEMQEYKDDFKEVIKSVVKSSRKKKEYKTQIKAKNKRKNNFRERIKSALKPEKNRGRVKNTIKKSENTREK